MTLWRQYSDIIVEMVPKSCRHPDNKSLCCHGCSNVGAALNRVFCYLKHISK